MKIVKLITIFWCLSLISLALITEISFTHSRIITDYFQWYVVGHELLAGHPDHLYPQPGATTFVGSPYDIAMHRIAPDYPPAIPGTYPYEPLVSILCIPCALIAWNYNFIAFQLVNIAVVIWVALRAHKDFGSPKDAALMATWLYPLASTIYTGQWTVLFGLLPLSLGYFLFNRGKHIAAGVAWSLIWLKPQYLPIPIIVTLATLNWRCALGLAGGSLVMIILNVFCLGIDNFMNWVHDALRLAETLFSGSVVINPATVGCLPGSILLGLPLETRLHYKWLIYIVCSTLGLVLVPTLITAVRRVTTGKELLAFATIIATITLPIYSRLLSYDLGLYMMAGLLAVSNIWDAETRKDMFAATLTILVVTNMQFVLAAALGAHLNTIVFSAVYIAQAACLCVLVHRYVKRKSAGATSEKLTTEQARLADQTNTGISSEQ